ncbi:MAG: hypothetical protein EXS18_02020 [Verrucomicrobiae bacterium]|nr:hypothetical protein [Verrucomicrobiae bacterium]
MRFRASGLSRHRATPLAPDAPLASRPGNTRLGSQINPGQPPRFEAAPVALDLLRDIHRGGKARSAAHFVEYIILSLLVFRAVRGEASTSWQANWMWMSLAIATVYAVLDETHQKWEAGRPPRLKHVLIDIAGILTAQVLIFVCFFATSPPAGR